MIEVVTKKVRKGLFHEIIYADNLVFMSNSTESIQKKFVSWKDLLQSKALKINNSKTKLMVSCFKGQFPTSKINPCDEWKKVTINTLSRMKCRKWIHGQCTKWKKVTSAMAEDFICKKCLKTRSEMSVKRLNDDVETVEGFCYFGNAFIASGGSNMKAVK